MDKWIHVKDRIPEIGIEVLVWNSNFNKVEIRYRLDEIYPSANDLHNVYVWNDQGIFNEIEYWMACPDEPAKKIEKTPCDCSNRNFKIKDGKLYGKYDGDFHAYDTTSYSFCPVCGENL